MNAFKWVGIALIVAGLLALAYGGFGFTRETHEGKLGPIEFSVKERETVDIPVWAGVAAVVAGGAFLMFGGRRG